MGPDNSPIKNAVRNCQYNVWLQLLTKYSFNIILIFYMYDNLLYITFFNNIFTFEGMLLLYDIYYQTNIGLYFYICIHLDVIIFLITLCVKLYPHINKIIMMYNYILGNINIYPYLIKWLLPIS